MKSGMTNWTKSLVAFGNSCERAGHAVENFSSKFQPATPFQKWKRNHLPFWLLLVFPVRWKMG